MRQYLLDKIDGLFERTRRLGRRTVGTAFAFEAHDGTFDNARVDAITTGRNTLMSDVSKDALEECRVASRAGDLKFDDSVLENPQGTHKADPIRIEISLASGFVDKSTTPFMIFASTPSIGSWL